MGTGEAVRSEVRLAELVAALSLGIDLGFGQPMEHVLRQCLIALRLAERIGLDEEARGGRLLHRAAGQRRLPLRRARAGEVVRRRHRAEVGQVRPRVPEPARRGRGDAADRRRATRRCTASGSASSSSLSGHREVDGMIAQHAALARALAEQLGLPEPVLEALARPTSSGTGAAGRASSRATTVPIAARLAQLAEFVEVAHRVGGVEAARRWRASAPASSSTRRSQASCATTARCCSRASTRPAPGTR